MPRSNIRERIYKSLGVDTLPCVWCFNRIHKDDKICTVEHILCQCVKELASNGYDNCKIACAKCNNLRSTLCLPELNTYRYWNILQGKEEEGRSDHPLMNAYFDNCKFFKRSPTTENLYEFMRIKCTKVKDPAQIELFTKSRYHQYYMEEMSKLLNVKVRY